MKIINLILLMSVLLTSLSFSAEKKDCSIHKKILNKMKCKTSNVIKPKGFFKKTIDKTIDYQKKAFEKKD